MKEISKILVMLIVFSLLWQLMITLFSLPDYILPTPTQVLISLYEQRNLIAHESMFTLIEIILGFSLGVLFGTFAGILIAYSKPLKSWFLPLIIISQAVPIFAIAPLIVIWLGYGLASKIMVTVLMIFFPITSACYDGLSETQSRWLDLAKSMHANRWRTFCFIRFPAALPSLASGIRIAAVIAPVGALIGEWVGASKGLGFLMLNANGRMQIDLMFATLIIVIVISCSLYFTVDVLLKRFIPWKSVTS